MAWHRVRLVLIAVVVLAMAGLLATETSPWWDDSSGQASRVVAADAVERDVDQDERPYRP